MALLILLWVEVVVISSAYEAICMFLGGCGMSCMNRLKSVGERTEP